MRPRTRFALIAIAAIALPAAVLSATLGHSGSDSHGPAATVEDLGAKAPHSPFKGALRPTTRAAGFSLRDQDGATVRLASRRGDVVLLSPMYTRCRDSCPLVAQQIRGALDDLSPADRAKVHAYALSVDPRTDTPTRARRFLQNAHVDGYLDFLLGDRAALRPLWRSYAFAPHTAGREHDSYVVLIDPRGRQRIAFQIDFLTPEALAHDIRILLRERA